MGCKITFRPLIGPRQHRLAAMASSAASASIVPPGRPGRRGGARTDPAIGGSSRRFSSSAVGCCNHRAGRGFKIENLPPGADDPGCWSTSSKQPPRAAAGCWSAGGIPQHARPQIAWDVPSCSGSSGSRVSRLSSRSTTRSSIPSSWPGTAGPEICQGGMGSLRREAAADPAFNHRLHWREIAARPATWTRRGRYPTRSSQKHVGRLKELLAGTRPSKRSGTPTWADRAAFDCSPAFERHRRSQSAKTRELLRTLDTLRKMRNAEWELGTGMGMQMADGGCQMADERMPVARTTAMTESWRAAWSGWLDERESSEPIFRIPHSEGKRERYSAFRIPRGGHAERESGEPMTDVGSGPNVGDDSDRVTEDSTNDKIGILSHEDVEAAGQARQGEGLGQSLQSEGERK